MSDPLEVGASVERAPDAHGDAAARTHYSPPLCYGSLLLRYELHPESAAFEAALAAAEPEQLLFPSYISGS
jgi:hypothetical protein